MNKLSSDIIKYISSFLDDKNTSQLVITNKSLYELRYELTYIDYKYALKYNDNDKNKIEKIINCNQIRHLHKFKKLKSLTFCSIFNNDYRPIKKSDLPKTLTSLCFGKYFNNGGKPIN